MSASTPTRLKNIDKLALRFRISHAGHDMKSMRHTPSQTQPLISNDELTQLLAISADLESERPTAKVFDTHHVYMQFLEFTLANASTHGLPALTLNEQHLLEQIAVRCEMDKPISVIDACQMRQFGCASTIHHLIYKLSAAGLIHLDAAPSNLRKKFIQLSPIGQAYFQKLEDFLDMALLRQ
jgi:DNA-binding MarR family transcriptional regulator